MMSQELIEAVKEFESQFLFHGTLEEIEGKLRAGGDGLLWLAEDSAVAQSYIPAVGGSVIFSFRKFELDYPIRPDDESIKSLAEQAGVSFPSIETDDIGRLTRWQMEPPDATNQLLVDYLEDGLGYKPRTRREYSYKVKASFEGGEDQFFPADYEEEGLLFIVSGWEQLEVADMTTGDPASELDPEYLHYDLFEKLHKQGFDAIKIPDLLQSDKWGNVGHDSYGVFASSVKKLSYISIPAKNYDPDDFVGWSLPTPEFVDFFLMIHEPA